MYAANGIDCAPDKIGRECLTPYSADDDVLLCTFYTSLQPGLKTGARLASAWSIPSLFRAVGGVGDKADTESGRCGRGLIRCMVNRRDKR